MTHWKIIGIIATLVIVLSIPVYVVHERAEVPRPMGLNRLPLPL